MEACELSILLDSFWKSEGKGWLDKANEFQRKVNEFNNTFFLQAHCKLLFSRKIESNNFSRL